MDRGYISSVPPLPQRKDDSNVSSFPAYPKLATLLKTLTGLSTSWSLIIVAWIFNILFWYLLILVLRSLKLPSYEFYLSLLAAWSFPSSFYLSAAYTESLFLSLLLLYLNSSSSLHQIFAGLGLGLTRLVGMPLAIAFIAKSYFEKKLTPRKFLIAFTPTYGAFLFFLYAEIKFGTWDLYFQTSNIGWNVNPNYLFFLNKETWWTPMISPWSAIELLNTDLFSWNVTVVMTWILLGSSIYIVAQSIIERKFLKTELAYFLSAGILYFIPAAGFYNLHFMAMSRYVFPAFICWLIWFVANCQRRNSTVWFWLILGAFIIWGLPFKLSLLRLFMEGRWVA